MTDDAWSLKAWVSAHVYLGLSLIVIATLHTGFQFGWNVHTLAYALMMLVILSGRVRHHRLCQIPPIAVSDNRGETTQKQMLEKIHALDGRLLEVAQPARPGPGGAGDPRRATTPASAAISGSG